MGQEENDELKFENELEKLKQEGQFGAKFFEGNSELPPEMEAEWLKNIRAFEESHQNVPEKAVGEIIGNPVLKPVSEIEPENMEAELEKLLELLEEHDIALDYDEEVPPSEIYRFITEELVNQETDGFDMPGMTTHFIYEEFYPNHAKDILRYCDSFCQQLFNQDEKYLDAELDSELAFADGTIMTKEQFVEKAKLWFAAYENFTINDLRYMKPEFSLEQGMGHVHTYIDYDARLEDGNVVNFSGPGIFYMHFDIGFWFICGMDFPGFKEWALQ